MNIESQNQPSRVKTTVSVGAWLLSYTYVFHLVGAYADTCTQGDDSPYVASLILGPGTLALTAAAIWVGKAAHRRLRWFALPHVPLLALSVYILAGYAARTTFGGAFICAANGLRGPSQGVALLWHRLYAVGYIGAALLFSVSAWAFWRRGEATAYSDSARHEVVSS